MRRALLLWAGLAALSALSAAPLKLYVAPHGSDAWSGTLAQANPDRTDGPLATLEGARGEIRKRLAAQLRPAGGITVEVQAGTYELARPLALTAQDSGTADSPIVWQAARGAEVRLVGGTVVRGWQPVTDPAVLARLDESARGKVLQADLKALGVTDLGQVVSDPDWTRSEPGLELFFADQPMTIARWPNDGLVKMGKTVGPTPNLTRNGREGCVESIFEYDGDRPQRWVGEPDGMLHGYWALDWADQRYRIGSIDTAKKVIQLAGPNHAFGFRDGRPYYAYNLLCELDQPGEWYLDRARGVLYFWPPSPIERSKAIVSVLPHLVTVQGATRVTLRGFTMEGARGDMVTIGGGQGVQVIGCTIRNGGGWAVAAHGGTDHRVAGCDVYQMAMGGVALSGGDRRTLAHSGHAAENNHIHHYSRWRPVYRPGVSVSGVGNRIAHNLIHDAPHMAIGFGGNENAIEYNEIHSVVYHSNDAGAMYCGYDWSARGQVIRYNYLHDIYGYENRGCVGVYLDDQFSSARIEGNLFWRVPNAAFIGGGRDSTIANNVFVDCNPAVHVDARGLGWAAHAKETLTQRLKAVPYQSEPWRTRYPQLLTLLDNPNAMAPQGNLVARNVRWGGRWDDLEPKARPHVTFTDNLTGEDPHFVDAPRGDFRLKDDSPAFKLGFKSLPIEKMGLYASDERATWPVRHTVRPAPVRPPDAKTPRGAAPVARALRAPKPPFIDGVLAPGEWLGTELRLAQGVGGERLSPACRAWVAHDGAALLVAFEITVDPAKPLQTGNTWGKDDAVELSLASTAAKDAPIIVLRGFAGGAWVSSDEAGAPPPLVQRAGEGVRYAAKVVDARHWTAEWRIPFASLAIGAAKPVRRAMNLSVRQTSPGQWLMWRGTEGFTWSVSAAGWLEIMP